MQELSQSNYYDAESNKRFFSVSQFKDFRKCEAMAMAKISGEYKPEMTRAMLVLSLIHI